MTTKWVLVLFFPLLLGFSTSDNVKYIAEYDTNKIKAELLFKSLESYAISQGFELKKQIKEAVPRAEIVSILQSGVLFQGGVYLELILDEGNQQISLTAKRYHGGCTRADSIEQVDKYRIKFQNHIKAKYKIDVNLKKVQEIQ